MHCEGALEFVPVLVPALMPSSKPANPMLQALEVLAPGPAVE